MKKSEMISKLKEILGEEEVKCKLVLDLLEREGMLPPTTKLKKLNRTDNAWEEED